MGGRLQPRTEQLHAEVLAVLAAADGPLLVREVAEAIAIPCPVDPERDVPCYWCPRGLGHHLQVADARRMIQQLARRDLVAITQRYPQLQRWTVTDAGRAEAELHTEVDAWFDHLAAEAPS